MQIEPLYVGELVLLLREGILTIWLRIKFVVEEIKAGRQQNNTKLPSFIKTCHIPQVLMKHYSSLFFTLQLNPVHVSPSAEMY